MKYLLLLFCSSFYGQVLHHQMLSSQGKSATLPNGIIVKQTIGQQSVTGNSKNGFVVQQGFQQSLWSKYISSPINPADITTVTYPNPFVSIVNFQFSKPIQEEISIAVYDIIGRLIFQQMQKPSNSILTIDLSALPVSTYLVRLSGAHLNYYTKILKKP
ncbi:MAG: T9SS type A sorting domain-containing protein [Lutibacter sp.]